jgi:hypothetical protein
VRQIGQIVLAIAGYFLLQLFVPRLWEKVMSEAPPWLARLAVFAAALACVAVFVCAHPVWARLSNPSQYPAASTIIVIVSIAAIGATAWWQFVVSYGTKKAGNAMSPSASATSSPEPTTLENVDSKIKEWVAAFPDFVSGGRIEEVHRANMHFAYHLIFADGYGVAVSRSKDQWGGIITVATSANLGDDVRGDYNRLSNNQKQRLIRDLGIEIAKARISAANSDPSKPIEITKEIPIGATLTNVEFYDSIREMHSGLRFIIDTMKKMIADTLHYDDKF